MFFVSVLSMELCALLLTTVHQPTGNEGHTAVRKIINMIFGKTEQSGTLKPFLAVRESTGGSRPDPEHPELEIHRQ